VTLIILSETVKLAKIRKLADEGATLVSKQVQKLYLDDKQATIDEGWVQIGTFGEAKEFVIQNGVPRIISFGYGLGVDEENNELPNAYDFAKWLIAADMNGEVEIPQGFIFKTHEQDSEKAERIASVLRDYLSFREDNCNA